MIRSMTGFGRALCDLGGFAWPLEVRSVNHRHLDVQLRLPRALSRFEPVLRARVRERLARGKVDLTIGTPSGALPAPQLVIDAEAAERYVAAARRFAEDHGLAADLGAAALLSLPGVARLEEAELPEQALSEALSLGADAALDALLAMREAEGAALAADLRERLALVGGLCDAIAEHAPEVQAAARERLAKRARELEDETGLLDAARLHQEVVLAADRLDVAEELTRLRSHVEQFAAALDAGSAGASGRRLEFLLQEMNREANTLGAKAGDAALAHRVVDLKTELERMREQALNVE